MLWNIQWSFESMVFLLLDLGEHTEQGFFRDIVSDALHEDGFRQAMMGAKATANAAFFFDENEIIGEIRCMRPVMPNGSHRTHLDAFLTAFAN